MLKEAVSQDFLAFFFINPVECCYGLALVPSERCQGQRWVNMNVVHCPGQP